MKKSITERIKVITYLLSTSLISMLTLCSLNSTHGHLNKSSYVCDNETEIITNVPVEDIFYNECCDELVVVQGIAHIVVNENIIHLVISDLTGTGLSTNYYYEGVSPSVMTNVFYSNQSEGTLTFKINMSNENGCSFRLKSTFHIEVNANGEVAVDFQNFVTKCHP